MSSEPLRHALDRAARPARDAHRLVLVVAGGALVVLLLAIASWLLRAGWLAAPQWILAVWLLLAIAIGTTLVVLRRAMVAWGARQVGLQLEHGGAWPHGALTTLLDGLAPDTSHALHAAAITRRVTEVDARGSAELARSTSSARRRAARAALVLAGAVIGLGAARPLNGASAMLWHPVRALRALVAPVQLHARTGTVARGDRAVLDVAVIGHHTATLYTRSPGESWRTADIVLDAEGNAVITTAPLVSDLVARVAVGGRSSAEVRIAVRIPAFLGAFTATAHYPVYLGREDESLPTSGDTLMIPEGTRLSFAGRATASLGTASLVGSQPVPLVVHGNTFAGELTPRQSGAWQLTLGLSDGGTLDGDLPAIPIRVIVDSAPVVEIPVPGTDTIASAALSLALVVGIRDDHGIDAAGLEVRRGSTGPVVRTPLALTARGSDRALVTTTIDLGAAGARPGDTLHYRATATDNAPAHHVGRSREFLVRVPTLTEQRAAQTRATAAVATGLDSLSQQATRLQRTEEDLARERQRSSAQNNGASANPANSDKDPLASDAARKAEAVAQAEQQQIEAAAKLQREINQLQQAAEKAGVADTALARQLGEISRLLDKALSPELRAKLSELQQAVKDLDAERTQQSMQDLATQQARLKAAMDQARELFKRAALETQLANMGQDAKQLASEQHDLNTRMAQGDSGVARAEQKLAQRTDSLSAGLQQAASQVQSQQSRQGLQQTADEAKQAAGEMRQAGDASQQGQKDQAQQKGQQAEQKLTPMSKKIEDDSRGAQAEMRAEVIQALSRALDETTRLVEKQFDVSAAMATGNLLPQTRSDAGVIAEGVAKVMQQITAISMMNALVSPQAGVSLAEARRLMLESVAAAASANPNLRDAVSKAGDASDALAVAAFSLLQSKDKVSQSQSGSGMQEAMAQMQQMAGKQGQMAQQGEGMMQSGQMSAQQLMQMALQQRAIAQQLERMRAGGQLPGAGQMAAEAKALSQSLQGGRLNQDVVERQQRLFKRMLDAGRMLQGEEDDDKKERQSVTAKDGDLSIPPSVDPRILNGAGEIRLPNWDALQKLSPDERRRVVDYFQRLARASKP